MFLHNYVLHILSSGICASAVHFCIRLSSISEGLFSHINSVWPVFLFEQLCLQLFLKNPYKPTIEPTFWPFS